MRSEDTQCQYAGLTLPLAIVAICYLKCRVATNICHWLKDSLGGSKITFFWFSNIVFIVPSHIITVPYFTLWMLDIFNTIRVANSLDPVQALHFVVPDLGPNCLQRFYQQTTKCLAGSGFKLFAKFISRQQNVWLDLGSNCLQRLAADNKSHP